MVDPLIGYADVAKSSKRIGGGVAVL